MRSLHYLTYYALLLSSLHAFQLRRWVETQRASHFASSSTAPTYAAPTSAARGFIETVDVKQWGVFDEASVNLTGLPAFIAITGETGSGKSVFISALEYICGSSGNSRARRNLGLRPGQGQGLGAVGGRESQVTLSFRYRDGGVGAGLGVGAGAGEGAEEWEEDGEGDGEGEGGWEAGTPHRPANLPPSLSTLARTFDLDSKKSTCELDGQRVLLRDLTAHLKSAVRFWSTNSIRRLDEDFIYYVDNALSPRGLQMLALIRVEYAAWVGAWERLGHLERLQVRVSTGDELSLVSHYAQEVRELQGGARALLLQLQTHFEMYGQGPGVGQGLGAGQSVKPGMGMSVGVGQGQKPGMGRLGFGLGQGVKPGMGMGQGQGVKPGMGQGVSVGQGQKQQGQGQKQGQGLGQGQGQGQGGVQEILSMLEECLGQLDSSGSNSASQNSKSNKGDVVNGNRVNGVSWAGDTASTSASTASASTVSVAASASACASTSASASASASAPVDLRSAWEALLLSENFFKKVRKGSQDWAQMLPPEYGGSTGGGGMGQGSMGSGQGSMGQGDMGQGQGGMGRESMGMGGSKDAYTLQDAQHSLEDYGTEVLALKKKFTLLGVNSGLLCQNIEQVYESLTKALDGLAETLEKSGNLAKLMPDVEGLLEDVQLLRAEGDKLARKHGTTPAGLMRLQGTWESDLRYMGDLSVTLPLQREEERVCRERYAVLAGGLSRHRGAAAGRLLGAVNAMLPSLEMPDKAVAARIVSPVAWGEGGWGEGAGGAGTGGGAERGVGMGLGMGVGAGQGQGDGGFDLQQLVRGLRPGGQVGEEGWDAVYLVLQSPTPTQAPLTVGVGLSPSPPDPLSPPAYVVWETVSAEQCEEDGSMPGSKSTSSSSSASRSTSTSTTSTSTSRSASVSSSTSEEWVGVSRSLSSGECARLALALETLCSLPSPGGGVGAGYGAEGAGLRAGNAAEEGEAGEVGGYGAGAGAYGANGAEGCLIFDEIDAHLGGEAAVAVARLLRKQGRVRQIVAVTHNPVIAAAADLHVVVERRRKRPGEVEGAGGAGGAGAGAGLDIGGVGARQTQQAQESQAQGAQAQLNDYPQSSIRVLNTLQREAELARMATGSLDTPAGRDLARALLGIDFDQIL